MSSLASQHPQVSTRARVYALQDDGASDRAQSRRSLKNSIASNRAAIARCQASLDGTRPTRLTPTQLTAAIASCEIRIARFQHELDEMAPPVIAPVGRRVKREDRRRNRKDANE